MTEAELLKRAYARLRLVLTYNFRRNGYVACDSDDNVYVCFTKDAIRSSYFAPTDVESFLEVPYFEHYGFPSNFKIIENVFFGMSREEMELRLAVMGV